MRTDNTIGNDKFFHCKANCEATRRGPGGASEARVLSALREFYGRLKGDPEEDRLADEEANQAGREGAEENPDATCSAVCSEFIVRGMNEAFVEGETIPETTPEPEPIIEEELQ